MGWVDRFLKAVTARDPDEPPPKSYTPPEWRGKTVRQVEKEIRDKRQGGKT